MRSLPGRPERGRRLRHLRCDARVRDVNRELDWALPEDEAMTVAGLLMAASRGLPKRGEVVEIAGYRLEASDLRGRRVARVRILAPRVEVPED